MNLHMPTRLQGTELQSHSSLEGELQSTLLLEQIHALQLEVYVGFETLFKKTTINYKSKLNTKMNIYLGWRKKSQQKVAISMATPSRSVQVGVERGKHFNQYSYYSWLLQTVQKHRIIALALEGSLQMRRLEARASSALWWIYPQVCRSQCVQAQEKQLLKPFPT